MAHHHLSKISTPWWNHLLKILKRTNLMFSFFSIKCKWKWHIIVSRQQTTTCTVDCPTIYSTDIYFYNSKFVIWRVNPRTAVCRSHLFVHNAIFQPPVWWKPSTTTPVFINFRHGHFCEKLIGQENEWQTKHKCRNKTIVQEFYLFYFRYLGVRSLGRWNEKDGGKSIQQRVRGWQS